MEKISFLRNLFENELLYGNLETISSQDGVCVINEIALYLYNKPSEEFTDKDIDDMKYLIMICNLLYNRTEMGKLPIDDGFYDLLLEKYRVFDPHFQVGSAVVDFKNTAEKIMGKPVITPIRFDSPDPPKTETNAYMREHIMREGEPYFQRTDFNISPIRFDNGPTTKRTHNTSHNHPDLVGTLDKCKFVLMADAEKASCINDPTVKIFERDFFHKHLQAGIIQPNQTLDMVIELKYDGVSVEADCTNVVESARTRGDTGIGQAADITPLLADYPFHNAGCMIGSNPIGVKFEAIMTKTNFSRFCEARGRRYANCRTGIISLFTASDGYKFRDYITLVPLALDRSDIPSITNRMIEIEFLNKVFSSHGEPLRYCYIKGNYIECLFYIKKFLEEASCARSYLNFMYDGIVVSYLDENIRATLGRENFINKYSMAVKFDPLVKQTIFRGYTYEVGQNGTITPMIHYDPVEFIGTIHTKSSGHSFERFRQLGLRYGDLIESTYRNDVMPYITKPDCEHNRKNAEVNKLIEPPTNCPVCGTDLLVSDSGKTLYCPNRECFGRVVGRTVNMLAKMNLKGFSDKSIMSIGKYTLYELIDLDMEYLEPRLGTADAQAFVGTMNRLKTEPIYDYTIVGALGFTGVAAEKWKKILSINTLMDIYKIYTEEGKEVLSYRLSYTGPITANTIVSEFEYFIDDIKLILSMPNVMVSKGSVKGKQIRFSGCRNEQLEQQLCNQGYDASGKSGVTKNTDILIVPYVGFESSKTRKMGNGIVVAMDDFINNMESYLTKSETT